MENEIGDAINVIKKWLQDGNLYYSIDDQRYLAGFHGGMGNFDLYQLPAGWTALIVESENSQESYSAAVVGELRSTKRNDDFQGYFVKTSKVISAKFCRSQHDIKL